MSTAQLIIVCVTALLLVAIVAAAWVFTHLHGGADEQELEFPVRVGHRVTVHTKQPDDQTIFGVLVGDYEDRVVLEDAEYVAPSGSTPMSGRQHVATENIAWIDVHAHVATLADLALTRED